MTAALDERPEDDTYYLVIPEDVWLNQTPELPDPPEEPEVYEEDFYYLEQARKPLSLAACTGLGGASGSLAFGIATGAVIASPVGMVAGIAAGIFGGLMGSSLAEELYDRKHS
ncbi:hypothetical protein SAMN05421504_108120 [Amycolatopsis xylanica]|uniref:Uncharacterized protein n=1 Tax=Amycolatopsis xylanica TaxID=589385 RepID=A0A1H3PB52_9PSEU|nr:hypothetical protein [Amycolatopsis xylanica]SDY98317.1 hypothetical protein SAMN05421504_108120 [Amycolatopsis xylanica]